MAIEVAEQLDFAQCPLGQNAFLKTRVTFLIATSSSVALCRAELVESQSAATRFAQE